MRSLLVLVLVLLLAGCAAITEPFGIEDPFAIPQPFQGVARNNEMLQPAVSGITSVLVETPKGLDPEFATELQRKLIRDLDDRDIGAVTEPMDGTWVLKSRAAVVSTADDKGPKRNVVIWRLFDPAHALKTEFSVEYSGTGVEDVVPRLPDLARQVGDNVLAAVTPAGTSVSAGLSDTVAQADTASTSDDIGIGSINGAPGDGNLALARALQAALPQRGFKVAADASKSPWRVQCVVTVQKMSAKLDKVTIVWSLLNNQSKVAGTLKQENPVPHGSLGKSWGPVAAYAAEGAADGVQQILQQIRDGKPK